MRTYIWINSRKYFWSDSPREVADELYKWMQDFYWKDEECPDIRIECVHLDPLEIDPDLQR